MSEQHKPDWTAYALDACQCIADASLFWTGEDEEKNPRLKRARSMAFMALVLERKDRRTHNE